MNRKVLNFGQVAVLELLYTYRFGSVELLQASLGLKNNSGLYQKLAILVEQGYIGKRYDSSYKLQGRPAAYYLLPKGLRVLQQLPAHEAIDEGLIKYSYKDKTASQAFMTHTLRVYSAALQLERLYPGLKFFTKRDLAHRKHFPEQLPDGFLSLKVTAAAKPYRYFLDVISESTPRYVIEKKIADYIEFFEEGGWDGTNSPLPVMLLLCEAGSFERRLQKIVTRKRQTLSSDELEYLTSTLTALKNASTETRAIWSNVEEPDELCELVAYVT